MGERRVKKTEEAHVFMKKKGAGRKEFKSEDKPEREWNYSKIFTTINSQQPIGKDDTDAFYEKFENWIDGIFGTHHIIDYFKEPDGSDFKMSDKVSFECKYSIEVGPVDHKIHSHIILRAKFPGDQRLQLNLDLLRELFKKDFGYTTPMYTYGQWDNDWKLYDYVFKNQNK
jgi:hypothetical protein